MFTCALANRQPTSVTCVCGSFPHFPSRRLDFDHVNSRLSANVEVNCHCFLHTCSSCNWLLHLLMLGQELMWYSLATELILVCFLYFEVLPCFLHPSAKFLSMLPSALLCNAYRTSHWNLQDRIEWLWLLARKLMLPEPRKKELVCLLAIVAPCECAFQLSVFFMPTFHLEFEGGEGRQHSCII